MKNEIVHSEGSFCKNCHAPLSKEHEYCYACGAKKIDSRLDLKLVFEEFSTIFLNIDNTFLKTFATLFLAPEKVIDGYVLGLRKRYLNVISYYTIGLTLAGLQIFILRKFLPESLNVPNSYNNAGQVLVLNWIYDFYSIIALLFIPVYALMAKLSFFNRKRYNYTEHLVAMAYISGQFTIISSIVTVIIALLGGNFYIAGNIVNIFLIIYTSYCYKRIFKLSLGQITLNIFLFLGIFMFAYMLLVLATLAVLFLTGNIDNIS